MKPAIVATGISKRYRLRHQRESFPTLRESVAQAAKRAGRRLVRPFQRPSGAQAELEEFWALTDVSFSVDPAERVGIIGRNGAGKSTLLKILSRITPPTAGEIEINGRVASLLEVGTGFHPDLTGRENVFLNGAILGMARSEIRAKFDEIVAFAEVDRFLDTPVKRYSSGMYVRLAFAVAAHLTPEILVVDEVLAVGDAEFQKKCLGVMRNASYSEGRTVFFVSHNMAAVQALCTKAILLDRGRVVSMGPVPEVIGLYMSSDKSGALNEGPVQGKDFELLSVRAGAPDFSPLSPLKPGLVEIRYRALSDLCDAGAHVIFEDLNGSPVLGLESKDFVEKVRARSGQEVTCTFRFDELPLNPGPFRLRVWLRSHSDHIHWEVPGSYEVRVEDALVYGVRRIDRLVHGTTASRARVEILAADDGG